MPVSNKKIKSTNEYYTTIKNEVRVNILNHMNIFFSKKEIIYIYLWLVAVSVLWTFCKFVENFVKVYLLCIFMLNTQYDYICQSILA